MHSSLSLKGSMSMDNVWSLGKICVCVRPVRGACSPRHTPSLNFGSRRGTSGYSVIYMPDIAVWFGQGRNGLWRMWRGASWMVRPAHAVCTGLAQWPDAGLLRLLGSACDVGAARFGEARMARLCGRQPALHQVLRVLGRLAARGELNEGSRGRVAA